MKSHSVFLRNGCVLPNRLDPLSAPVGEHWKRIEELDALIFDTMIRQAGWHFMWIQGPCARRGFGRSRGRATVSALGRALNGIEQRFNAAELNSVQMAKYLGVYVATVTVQPRQIQEETSLDCPNDI